MLERIRQPQESVCRITGFGNRLTDSDLSRREFREEDFGSLNLCADEVTYAYKGETIQKSPDAVTRPMIFV